MSSLFCSGNLMGTQRGNKVVDLLDVLGLSALDGDVVDLLPGAEEVLLL